MKENYDKCLALVLRYEGGYINHPNDPGGPTNKGVTQDVYDAWRKAHNQPTQSVKNISMDEVGGIYRQLYWDKIRGDDLPSGLDFAVFDFAVNSGVSRAAKYLQAIVGVPQDGQIGPQTIQACQTYLAMTLTNKRLGFMKSLAIWSTFGKGWQSRIDDVKKQIVAFVK